MATEERWPLNVFRKVYEKALRRWLELEKGYDKKLQDRYLEYLDEKLETEDKKNKPLRHNTS